MERRDFVEKQIDQLGRALAAMINKLLKGTNHGVSIESDMVQSIQDSLSIDLEKVSKLTHDELMEFLINERGYSFENLEKLAKVITLIRNHGTSLSEDSLKRIELSILNHLTKIDKDFFFERQMRIDHLKKSIATNEGIADQL